MSDERIVEVIAWATKPQDNNHPPTMGRRYEAERVLAALRDDGFEVYRPEGCELMTIEQDATGQDHTWPSLANFRSGRYRLVPISGETPKESE